MTRAEAIEAAARDLLALFVEEYPSAGKGDPADPYWPDLVPILGGARPALAMPPGPDWQAIARQLAAALLDMVAATEGYAQALADDADGKPGVPIQTAVGACIMALNRARAALSLTPKEPTP